MLVAVLLLIYITKVHTIKLVNFDIYKLSVFSNHRFNSLDSDFYMIFVISLVQNLALSSSHIINCIVICLFNLKSVIISFNCLIEYNVIWSYFVFTLQTFLAVTSFSLSVAHVMEIKKFNDYFMVIILIIVAFIVFGKFINKCYMYSKFMTPKANNLEDKKTVKNFSFLFLWTIEKSPNSIYEYFTSLLLGNHKNQCQVPDCCCHSINLNDPNYMTTHQNSIYHFCADFLKKINQQFPHDPILMTLYMYFKFRKLNNSWVINEIKLASILNIESTLEFAISQFLYVVEVDNFKKSKKEIEKSKFKWYESYKASKQIENYYEKVRNYVICSEGIIESLFLSNSYEQVLQRNIETLYSSFLVIQKTAIELNKQHVKRIFFLNYLLVTMNPLNRILSADLEIEYSNYKLRKDSMAKNSYKINKTFVLRVSADLETYGTVNYCSKNIEEILFYKTHEVLQSKIGKFMVGNLALNHDNFMYSFMTNTIYKQLKHTRTNFLLKKDGFVTKIEVTIYPSINYHSKDLEFFGFCKEVRETSSSDGILLLHESNLAVCGVFSQLFKNFGISPFLAQGYNETTYLYFFQSIFPEISVMFMNNKKAQLEKGHTVFFDFNSLLNYDKKTVYYFPNICEESLTRQREYTETLKSVYKVIGDKIRVNMRLFKKIELSQNCSIFVINFFIENSKLVKLLKNQDDVSLVKSSLFPFDTLREVIDKQTFRCSSTDLLDIPSISEDKPIVKREKTIKSLIVKIKSFKNIKVMYIFFGIFSILGLLSLISFDILKEFEKKNEKMHYVENQIRFNNLTSNFYLFYVISSRTALIDSIIGNGPKNSKKVIHEYDNYVKFLIEKIYKDVSDIENQLVLETYFIQTLSVAEISFNNRTISRLELIDIQFRQCYDLKNYSLKTNLVSGFVDLMNILVSQIQVLDAKTNDFQKIILTGQIGLFDQLLGVRTTISFFIFFLIAIVPFGFYVIWCILVKRMSSCYFQLILLKKEHFTELKERITVILEKLNLIIGDQTDTSKTMTNLFINNRSNTLFLKQKNAETLKKKRPKDFARKRDFFFRFIFCFMLCCFFISFVLCRFFFVQTVAKGTNATRDFSDHSQTFACFLFLYCY